MVVRPTQDTKTPKVTAGPKNDLFQWAVVGCQRIWVVGRTSGGMPYGLAEDEYHAPIHDDDPPEHW